MIDTEHLFIAAHLAFVPAAFLLMVKAVHLPAARRIWFSRSGLGNGVELVTLSTSAALCAYVPGLWIGFDMDGSTTPCLRALGSPMQDATPRGEPHVVEGFLPLSRDCRWGDGTHLELVPAWINAVIFTALAGAVLGTALTMHSLNRHRRHKTTRTSEKASR